MQAELYGARGGAGVADQTKRAIVDIVVRISIAGNVECVKEVDTESHHLFVPDAEVLEQRQIDLAVARPTLGTVVGCPKREGTRIAVRAGPIIYSRIQAWRCRWICAPPLVDGPVLDYHRAILVSAAESPAIGVTVPVGKNRHRES